MLPSCRWSYRIPPTAPHIPPGQEVSHGSRGVDQLPRINTQVFDLEAGSARSGQASHSAAPEQAIPMQASPPGLVLPTRETRMFNYDGVLEPLRAKAPPPPLDGVLAAQWAQAKARPPPAPSSQWAYVAEPGSSTGTWVPNQTSNQNAGSEQRASSRDSQQSHGRNQQLGTPARAVVPTTLGLVGPPIPVADNQPTPEPEIEQPLILPSNFGNMLNSQPQRLPFRIRTRFPEGEFSTILGYTPGQYPRQTPEGSVAQTPEPSPRYAAVIEAHLGNRGNFPVFEGNETPFPSQEPQLTPRPDFYGLVVGDPNWKSDTFHDSNINMNQDHTPQRSGNNETSLSDGKVALLVDIGSVGDIAGDRWLASLTQAFSNAGCPLDDIEQIRREKALNVSGVGSGSQVCNYNTQIPVAIPTQEGTLRAMLKVPTMPDSDLPGILGLQSLRNARSIIDTETNKLYMLGPGEYDLMKAMPPGTSVVQLEESPSGHLMMPCDRYHYVGGHSSATQ